MSKNEYLNYWNTLYSKQNYFGEGPTKLAKLAEKLFKTNNVQKILEVGCGQGRDAIYFSQLGLDVSAFDISANAIKSINSVKDRINLNKLYLFEHNVMLPLCAMVFLMDMAVECLLYNCYFVIESHRVFHLPIFLKLHFQVLGPMLFLQFLVPCLKSCSLSINL